MDETDVTIETALLDVDGSCRDVNFDGPTWSGLLLWMACVRREFVAIRVGATSYDTDETQVSNVDLALDQVQRGGGYAQVILDDGSSIVRHLQVFVFSAPNEPLFVELSFFPQDVFLSPPLHAEFISWVDAISRMLGATQYFVRYENASWKFGDVTPSSGVFLVRASKSFGD